MEEKILFLILWIRLAIWLLVLWMQFVLWSQLILFAALSAKTGPHIDFRNLPSRLKVYVTSNKLNKIARSPHLTTLSNNNNSHSIFTHHIFHQPATFLSRRRVTKVTASSALSLRNRERITSRRGGVFRAAQLDALHSAHSVVFVPRLCAVGQNKN